MLSIKEIKNITENIKETDEYKLGIPRTPVKGGKTPRNA